ncbi:MAG: hypothetical protein H7329_17705 [Opitutaceae bacterium]|nr:hypothetical protein [Cytophagales bacterium]
MADTILVEKAPLIITQKIYVLDTNSNIQKIGLSVVINAGIVNTRTFTDEFRFSRGQSYSIALNFERNFDFLRFRAGIGLGQYQNVKTDLSKLTVNVETRVMDSVVVERYYKVKDGETTWYEIKEGIEVLSSKQSQITYESQKRTSYFFIQIPVSLSVIYKVRQWDFELGADLESRYVNSSFSSGLNLLAGSHVGVGYYLKETLRLSLKPNFLTDFKSTSTQFRNNFLQVAFDTTFFW